MAMFDTVRHLLPRGRAWRMVIDRAALRLIRGLANPLDSIRLFADRVFLDLFPAETYELIAWERQFALPPGTLTVAERRTRLAARWQAQGGQDPYYITTTLQAHGFDVYTHPWWTLTAWGVPNPRDPRDYLLPAHGGTDSDGYLLGNQIYGLTKTDEIGAGEAWAEAGEPRALSGYFLAHASTTNVDQYVGGSERWPYYLYIGGATFPNTVNIPTARRTEFERLVRMLCPAHLWIVLRVVYV